MKRIFILLTMAVAAITACTKASSDLEEERINPESATYTYTITANNGTPDVKTNYDSDGSFKWSDGDAISVLFHNSDAEVKNKFFTLTLVSGANTNTATFSGEIETGYTIGASDGTEADKKIWALFPASDNHSYTEGSNPSFYVQPFVDFTATHFSANIPMYALNAAEGTFSFANLASTYKFTVKNIKQGVEKVIFKIYNQTTYGLSGSWPIASDKYINYNYADPGSDKSTLTYVGTVTNQTAEFYVSCRYWGTFQPVITIKNYATGVDIKTFTAGTAKQPNYMDHVWPITLDVKDGDYFTPIIEIDGDMSDWDPSTNNKLTDGTNYKEVIVNGAYWKEFKVAYDEKYFYFYAKRNYNPVLWTDNAYFWFKFDKDNDGDFEDDTKFYIHPFKVINDTYSFEPSPKANDPSGTASSSFNVSCAGEYDANVVVIEVRALRTDLGINKNDVIGVLSNANKDAGNITIPGTLTINN